MRLNRYKYTSRSGPRQRSGLSPTDTQMTNSQPVPEIDYSRRWYVMAAVAMGVFLATIDGSIVNVALPTLVEELNTEFATVQWVVLAYLLTLSTLLLSIGRLAVDMLMLYTVPATLCTRSADWIAAGTPNN